MRVFRSFKSIQLQLIAALMISPSVQAVRIAGSDLLSEEISSALLSELRAVDPDSEMELLGSIRAMDALSAGEVNACILAVPDGSEQPPNDRIFGFAFQIVAFGVNQRNPLEELDYRQLESIFESGGATDTWSGLVDAGRLQDRNINLWAARSETVIALEIFNHLVLNGSSLKDSLRYDAQSAEQLMQVVKNDDAALILIPNMPTTEEVRILAIKESPDGQSYTPTPDNVFYGDYPLRLPFKLVVDEDLPESALSALLRAIYSDRVTDAIGRAFFMPLPELERRAVLDQLK